MCWALESHCSHIGEAEWVVLLPFDRGGKLLFKEATILSQSETNKNKKAKHYVGDIAAFPKSPVDIKTLRLALGLIVNIYPFLSFF